MRFNRTIRVPLTLDSGADFAVDTNAYTANDIVGGLSKFFYGTGGGAWLMGVEIIDDAVQNEPYLIHIYSTSTGLTVIADDAAAAFDAADGALEIGLGTINAGDYVEANGGAYSKVYADCSVMVDESSGGTIYVYLECTDTPDYAAAGDLVINGVFWIE